MTIDLFQICLIIFGGLPIYLVGRTDRWQRWGYVAGIIGQPFWLYATYQSRQVGMIVLSCWITWSWVQGFWNHWIKKEISNANT